MPHILEAIFFSLDYESYKVCLNVSMVWKSMLTSKAFQKKGESVFHKDILLEQLKLQQSAQNGNKDVVINLLSTGMLDIDCGSTWNRWSLSPLGLAAYSGHKDMVELLLDRGADINKESIFGTTPLHFAAERGNIEAARLLISLGAKPQLTKAAANRQEKIISGLLQAGVDPDITDSDGQTALMRASILGHLNIVQILLQRGANPNKEDLRGNTPLHLTALWGCKNVANQLIFAGAELNKTNLWGATPLLYAVKFIKKEIVQLLVDSGADQTIASENGITPISLAHKLRYEDIILILTRQGPPGQLHPQPQVLMAPLQHQQPLAQQQQALQVVQQAQQAMQQALPQQQPLPQQQQPLPQQQQPPPQQQQQLNQGYWCTIQ